MSRRGKEAGRQPMSSASTTPCASGWGSLCARPCPSPSATRCIGAASNCSCTATISVVYDRSLSHYPILIRPQTLLDITERAEDSDIARESAEALEKRQQIKSSEVPAKGKVLHQDRGRTCIGSNREQPRCERAEAAEIGKRRAGNPVQFHACRN